MGAKPYTYTVPFDADAGSALRKLRADVFKRGEYYGADSRFATPDEALEASEEGTHSILDITRVGEEPGYCTASFLAENELQHYFGTATPTLET